MIRSSSKKIAVTVLTLATLAVNFSFAAINSENREFGNCELKTGLNVKTAKVSPVLSTNWVVLELAGPSFVEYYLIEIAGGDTSPQLVGAQPQLPSPSDVRLSNLD